MTVLSLLEEMRTVRQRDSGWYRDAEIRERIVFGENDAHLSQGLSQATAPPPGLREPMHENVLLPALETKTARINQGRIDAKAWPHTPTPARIAAAEGANLLLDAQRAREKRTQKVFESVFLAYVHGHSGVYTTWDESDGPHEAVRQMVDPRDGLPTFDADGLPQLEAVQEWGDIRVEVLTAFEYWTSGEDKPEDTRWQVRQRAVDKYTAKRALLNAKNPDGTPNPIVREPTEKTIDMGKGEHRRKKGVEVLEIWVKPGAMLPDGMFALVVDDCVCRVMPYPLLHKRLPITPIHAMRVSDSPHGHTVVQGAVFQQRLLNVALRSICRRADIEGDARCIGADEIVDNIDEEGEGLIRYNGTKPWSDAAGWMVGAPITSGLFQVYQLAKRALNDVIGVSSDSIDGGDAASTSSGEQLKTAAALDSQKDALMRANVEMSWEEVDKQKLELFRQKATLARLVSVVGDPVRAMYLRGADLDGVDVAIEQASGYQQTHLAKAANAEQGAAAGFVPPQDAAEMRQTGQEQTVLSVEQQQRVDQQATAALRGVPQQPLPGIPPQQAARRLRAFLTRVEPGQSAALLQLVYAYENAPQMMQPGMPAGAPEVTPNAEQALTQSAGPGVIQ